MAPARVQSVARRKKLSNALEDCPVAATNPSDVVRSAEAIVASQRCGVGEVSFGRKRRARRLAGQLKPQLPNQVHDAFALTANGAKSNDHWWDFGNQIRSLGMIFLMPVLY